MQRIQGMPYVPGTVRGLVTRDPRDGCIWLTEQSRIGSLRAQPAGAIVVDAAPFSHSLIALLARGVPTVLLTREQGGTLREGEVVQLDGAAGCVVSPELSPQSLTPVPVAPPAGRAVHTADNVAVELRASVRDAAGARRAHANGACAIGLVRSEFLVPPDGAVPDADFYEQALGQVCAAAQTLPVVIRLLDIAPDKRPAWLGALSEQVGPLGLQGVRLFDHEPVAGVVQAQLEAVARLQRLHALRLLLPYVRSTGEIHQLRDIISARLAKPLLVGVMLETPAAALEIAHFCEAADFVALGTNDLMQCLFGADRDRPEVASLLDPYAPVLYRFLRSVAENAGPHLIRVQVCGLLAQLSGCLELLLGLGFRVFSVDPVFIPYLAETVARTDTARARALAEQVCAAPSSREARLVLERHHAAG